MKDNGASHLLVLLPLIFLLLIIKHDSSLTILFLCCVKGRIRTFSRQTPFKSHALT